MSMNKKMEIFPSGVALVFGGSGGIGAAICQELARSGTDIALTYRGNKARATAVCQSIREIGQQAEGYPVLIGDGESVRATVEQAIADFGHIHTVVIAAGSDIGQPLIADMTSDQWREVIDQDLNGFVHIIQATIGHLRKAGGSYVHISSSGLQKWPKGDVLSVVPKAAIEALIQGIAVEEGRHNVRANSVALGVIEAGIFERLEKKGIFDEKWHKAVLHNLAIKRLGKAEEVGHAVVFLASNRAAYVTGQMISVSGGYGL